MVLYINVFQVMMLIQSSLLSPTAAGISSVCDRRQQEFSCVWIPGDLTWQGPTPVTEHKNTDDDSCSQEFLGCSSPSPKVNMSEASTFNFVYKRRAIQRNSSSVLPLSQNSSPTFVYKRRKVQKKSTAVFPAQVSNSTRASESCFSADSSEAASVAGKEHMISLPEIDNEGLMPPNLVPVQSNRLDLASKLGSIDVALLQHEPMIEENPERRIQKALQLCAVNDNCSSSRSNMNLDSACMKLQVDDVDECSSSGALVMDSFEKGISEKNPCISFLRQHGVLERSLPIKTRHSEKQMAVRKNTYCLRPCKICNQSETTLKMLICDLCEESFHVSCCNPSMRKVSVDEWFCHSCLRKKLKKLKETTSRKSKDSSGPIAAMLRGVEPYTSNVRIGKDFQAKVPDWSGPTINDVNDYEESVESSPVDCGSYQGWDSGKLSRLSSIGNWLQCREVINGDGTICGKWRRAPLFEVQTDDWECFRSVLWDPTHADCAVPQEMDTDQVLKHLKYIEMLRPQLAVKRCKLGVNKQVDSQ